MTARPTPEIEPLDPDSPEGRRVAEELGDHMARVKIRIARDRALAAAEARRQAAS